MRRHANIVQVEAIEFHVFVAPNTLPQALFGMGAVLLRGAGCTINDLWDRSLDKQVGAGCAVPAVAVVAMPSSTWQSTVASALRRA